MPTDWSKHQAKERKLFWKQRIRLWRHFIGRAFPSDFFGSLWFEWIERIEAGHGSEVARVDKLAAEYEGYETHPDDPPWDPMDDLSEDYHESLRVSKTMYAGLVVALWADVERLLKDHVQFARFALKTFSLVPPEGGEKKRNKTKRERFDEDPRDKKGISDWLMEFTLLETSSLPSHAETDAVRLLNNSFKHAGSQYKPEAHKPWTHIDPGVLSSLTCVGSDGKIDYSKVPFERLVAACRDYCLGLSDQLIASLERLQPKDFLKEDERG